MAHVCLYDCRAVQVLAGGTRPNGSPPQVCVKTVAEALIVRGMEQAASSACRSLVPSNCQVLVLGSAEGRWDMSWEGVGSPQHFKQLVGHRATRQKFLLLGLVIDRWQDEMIACRTELTADGPCRLVTLCGRQRGTYLMGACFSPDVQALERPRRARMSGIGAALARSGRRQRPPILDY